MTFPSSDVYGSTVESSKRKHIDLLGKKTCYYKSCIFLLFINVFILFKHEQFQMLGMQ